MAAGGHVPRVLKEPAPCWGHEQSQVGNRCHHRVWVAPEPLPLLPGTPEPRGRCVPTVTFCRRLRGLQSQKAAWHSGLPRATGLCVTTVCGSAAPRDDRGGLPLSSPPPPAPVPVPPDCHPALGDRWHSVEVINSRAPHFNAKMSPWKYTQLRSYIKQWGF